MAAEADPEVARQIEEFFAGKRQAFDFPLAPKGSEFQKRVWAELVKIPFGETISYGELARRIGNPAASRAVGRANATNPIARDCAVSSRDRHERKTDRLCGRD